MTGEYLAEYDAIEVAPYWFALFRETFSSATGPGQDDDVPEDAFREIYRTLFRRADELEAFFRLGGVLVAWLYEPAFLYPEGGGAQADTHWWFMRHINFPGKWPGVEPFGQPGHGVGIAVLDPTHPLGPYLEMRDGYVARVAEYLRKYPDVSVLAENRAGEPVSVVFRVGLGSIALVPPPVGGEQQKTLTEAVEQMAGDSTKRSRAWTVAEERELEGRRDDIVRRLAQERQAADARLQDIKRAKAAILDERHVRRAIDYVESALRSETPLDRRIGQLHKLVEMLEDYTGSGERGLGEVLQVDLTRIKRLKKLANSPVHDLRHAGVDDPSSPAAAEVREALETGRLLVAAFIEFRYRDAHKAALEPTGD